MRKVKLPLCSYFAAIIFPLCASSYAWAEEHGAHAAHQLPPFGEFLSGLWVYWINFILFVAIVSYFAKNALTKTWAARRLKISEHISTAKEALTQSQVTLREAEQRMSSLVSDTEQLKRDIDRETQDEAKQILEEAKSRAERVVKLARDASAAERRTAERNVRRELVEMAIERTRQNLVGELTMDSDRQFREAALTGVKSLVQ